MTTFGEQLHSLRQEKGLTLRELAEQVNVDFTTISHIEHGRMFPSAYVIYRLARALDTSASELFCLSGKVPYGLKALLSDNPLLTELVYLLSEGVLPDAVYQEMIVLAHKAITGHEYR